MYLHFDGHEMVAIIREREDFHKDLELGTPLQEYADIMVSLRTYGAAKAIEALLPT